VQRVALGALAAGAGVIHLAMVPAHSAVWVPEGVFFAAVGWAQLACAVAIYTPAARRVVSWSVALNVAVIGVWLLSRTAGFPLGPDAGSAEPVSFVDVTATGLELAFVIGTIAMARPSLSERRSAPPLLARLAPAAVVAGLTSAALVTASGHHTVGHDPAGQAAATGGQAAPHAHGSTATLAAATECDALKQSMTHHWDAAAADELTRRGCNAAATAAAASPGDPALDAATFVDRLYKDIDDAFGNAGLSVCAAPNIEPNQLGAEEGVAFHVATSASRCAEARPERNVIVAAAFPSRFARDAAATAGGSGAAVRYVYGRLVIAALAPASASVLGRLEAAMRDLPGATFATG
jgi:hypothetical protein